MVSHTYCKNLMKLMLSLFFRWWNWSSFIHLVNKVCSRGRDYSDHQDKQYPCFRGSSTESHQAVNTQIKKRCEDSKAGNITVTKREYVCSEGGQGVSEEAWYLGWDLTDNKSDSPDMDVEAKEQKHSNISPQSINSKRSILLKYSEPNARGG